MQGITCQNGRRYRIDRSEKICIMGGVQDLVIPCSKRVRSLPTWQELVLEHFLNVCIMSVRKRG